MGDENAEDNTGNVPRFLDDIEMVDRKRIKLDNFDKKRWSLTDRREDQEILAEMGVGLLEPDSNPHHLEIPNVTVNNKAIEPRSNIENLNPNVSRAVAPTRSKRSPRISPRAKHKPSPHRVSRDFVGERAAMLSITEEELHTTTSCFPLDLLDIPGAQSSSPVRGSVFDSDANVTSLSDSKDTTFEELHPSQGSIPQVAEVPTECASTSADPPAAADYSSEEEGDGTYSLLSDEMVLSIFKWLPKKSLVQCMLVCRRFHRLATDEWFWERIDLGGKTLVRGALAWILSRKPIVVRMAGSEIGSWDGRCVPSGPSKIQYLDLSMAIIDTTTLNHLLDKCTLVKKLSIEHVTVNEQTCKIIGKCSNLETLNMAMCLGATAAGLQEMFEGCENLQVLNISWCQLDQEGVAVVCTKTPRRLTRLNLAGCRRTLSDALLQALCSRCKALCELDVSDCVVLTVSGMLAATWLPKLEHLALSRCYNIPPSEYVKLTACPTLQYLEVWGTLTGGAVEMIRSSLRSIQINQFIHSAVARPTVGSRRTSIWGIRTRD